MIVVDDNYVFGKTIASLKPCDRDSNAQIDGTTGQCAKGTESERQMCTCGKNVFSP